VKKLILIGLVLIVSLSYGQKQSLYAQYPNLVFREVFNDEQSTRQNGGVPTAVTYQNGSGVFNGSSSRIIYSKSLSGTYSVRIRFNSFTPIANAILFDFRNSNGSGTGVISQSPTPTTAFATTGTIYVDGTETNNISSLTKEIIVSGITIKCYDIFFFSRWTGSVYSQGSIDYIEIYNRALSASEIYNMYLGVHHKDLTLTPLIDFNSTAGQIKSSVGNVWTASNATTKRAGSIFSSSFNGTTSYLSTPNVNLSGNITVIGWFKMDSFGQNSLGNILNDSKLIVRVNSTNSVLQLSRDGSTYASSAPSALQAGKVYLFAATSTNAGVTNLYLAEYKSPVTISGTANQSAGTPANGSTILIGNNSTSSPTRTFKGIIPKVQVFGSILTINQITQAWSNKATEIGL
jgi:hypothetical protein